MSSHTLKKLDKSQIELTVTVPSNDYEKHLPTAAIRLSERGAVKGFRPGHVPYDVMKREVGEMAILQEALEKIVQESFYNAITSEKLDTIGMPKIAIEKIAPGNDIVYKATVALLPKVTLPDFSKISVTRKLAPVTDEQMNEVIGNLAKMQAKEVLKNANANESDKVIIDMDMLLDNVPVEGGQAKGYGVYLSEDHYIPGFNKELVGLKKDDTKEFQLQFPDTHYQKHLAGKKVTFKVKVNDVFDRQFPEANDEFAKALGQESMEKLKELLRNNLGTEAEKKADEKAEIEMLDALIDGATFDEIPEVLIDAERQKMFYELQRDLERAGIPLEKYLEDLKKTEEEIFNDFKDRAIRRAKAALLSRHVAHENNITIADSDVDAEIKMMEDVYKDNPEYLENLKKPEVRDSIRTMLQNKKVIQWLKEKMVK